MMHDNIYDVTFSDGVTKKCYLYQDGNGDYIVDCNTLIGSSAFLFGDDITINENNNTATCLSASTTLDEENLPYNYFQNSNLSAWKVWYCLDNDKSRFAWADDSDSYGIICPGNIDGEPKGIYIRDVENDVGSSTRLYAWYNKEEDAYCYTFSPNPKIGDSTTDIDGDGASGAGKITGFVGFGRGVIYRLIDEFNNDVPYDFKNIQYVRKLTNGVYDAQGTDTWCYTFNGYNLETQELMDATLHHGELLYEDDYIKHNVANNTILSYTENMLYSSYYCLPNICILDTIDTDNDHGLRTYCNHINSCSNLTIQGDTDGVTFIETGNTNVQLNDTKYLMMCSGGGASLITYDAGIYIRNKKVLTET